MIEEIDKAARQDLKIETHQFKRYYIFFCYGMVLRVIKIAKSLKKLLDED